MKKRFDLQKFLIVFTVFLGAFMRLYRIQDYMTFLGDEGRDALVAYNILHGHFTLLGPTASVGGFYFGPIYYYFMAPFLFLFQYNPVGPAVMVAIIGTITVWLVYKFGSVLFNKPVGLIAALLYALSPVIVAYSRSSWNPNPLPFFSILTLYFLYKATVENKITWFIISGICLGLAIELHFIALILAVIVFMYVLFTSFVLAANVRLMNRIQTSLVRYYYIGIGFIIGFLPYLGFEVRHGFTNTIHFFLFVFQSGKISGTNSNFFFNLGNVFFRIFGRFVSNFPDPTGISFKSPVTLAWIGITLILGICGSCLFFMQIRYSWKNKSKTITKDSLVFFWFICGLIIFGFYKRQIYDYYFAFFYPIPFLLIANFLWFIYKKNIWLKGTAVICFVWLLYINILGIPFRYEPNRQLKQVKDIAQFVNSKTNGLPFNFALITGGNSDHAYRYFFTLWHREPQTIQNPIVDPQRTSVTNQLLIVCESIPCYPLGNSLFEIAGFGRADIAGHWNISVVQVYKLIHYKGN